MPDMTLNSGENTRNVLTSVIVITAIILLILVVLLWFLTKDIYLDLYYVLETLFDAPNSVASFYLAEIAFASTVPKLAAMTTLVIIAQLSRVLFISFIIAAVLDMIVYSNIDAIINAFKASRMSNHAIICGYSPLAEDLVVELKKAKKKFVVVEHNKDKIAELIRLHIIVIPGNYADEHILKRAGISRARAILFTSQDDFENVLGAITAKKMNDKIKVLTKAGKEEIRKKLYRVGADMCVLPEYLAGLEMGEKIVDMLKSREVAQ